MKFLLNIKAYEMQRCVIELLKKIVISHLNNNELQRNIFLNKYLLRCNTFR